MSYQLGTLEEFNSWHSNAMRVEGIPADGKINFNRNKAAPDKQKTLRYSVAIPNSTNSKRSTEYAWCIGKYALQDRATLDIEQLQKLGWFPDA